MKLTVKRFGNVYKLIYAKTVSGSQGGFLADPQSEQEKELCNLARARSSIRELALCNPWEYFVTLTLNPDKQDRFSLDDYVRDLGVWIGNYNKKFHTHLKYLLVPEQHKNGAWHMHGLLHDVSPESVCRNIHGYLDMPYYANRFGFISLDSIKDQNKCSSYITKYVTKDTGKGVEVSKHLYYHSRGLEKAEVLTVYDVSGMPMEVWQNDYVGIEWADDDEALCALLARLEILS
ncbi:MAG: hypothetical protein OSJ54_13685 [Oscillospiraceae bacterium]|nr:hypothetical protein [Oscillospiraceae bacterium]